jgi:hypothetical protein
VNSDETMSNDAFVGQEETKVTPGETKVTPEESKLKSAEPEVKKRKPRIVFDPVTKSEMPATELHRLQREREEERARQHIDLLESEHVEREHDSSLDGRKSQLVSQTDNPLESSQKAALEPTPPDAGHGPSKISNEQTSQLEIEHKSIPPRAFSDAEDDDDSKPREQIDKLEPERQPSPQLSLPDGEEQTGQLSAEALAEIWSAPTTPSLEEEPQRQEEASNQATRIEPVMERCLNKRLSEGYADPYQVGGYKHLLGIFAFLYSTYIIGIGVTMAITPNVRTLVYTSIPLVPEASVKVVGVIMQVRLDWRRYRRVVVSQAKRRDLEHAGRESRQKQIFDRVSQVQRSDYERSYERDRHHLMTRG